MIAAVLTVLALVLSGVSCSPTTTRTARIDRFVGAPICHASGFRTLEDADRACRAVIEEPIYCIATDYPTDADATSGCAREFGQLP